MANNPWKDIKPNLSKLPAHLRKDLTKQIPLRENEVYSRIVIYSDKPGLNYPNGRVFAEVYNKDPNAPSSIPEGVQISLSDYSARIPLVGFVLEKEDVLPVLRSMAQAYLSLGGTEDELKTLLPQGNLPPRIVNPMFPEEPNDR